MDRAIQIDRLIEEAEQAADAGANGLMVQEDFVEVIRKLLATTRELTARCDDLQRRVDRHALDEHERGALGAEYSADAADDGLEETFASGESGPTELMPINVDRLSGSSARLQKLRSRITGSLRSTDSALFIG